MWARKWRRSSVAVWVLLICAPFGNLAVMPLFVLVLFEQWGFGAESATAESEDNADTKTVFISVCKLFDTYCGFNLASAMFQAAV